MSSDVAGNGARSVQNPKPKHFMPLHDGSNSAFRRVARAAQSSMDAALAVIAGESIQLPQALGGIRKAREFLLACGRNIHVRTWPTARPVSGDQTPLRSHAGIQVLQKRGNYPRRYRVRAS